jgi:5'-methylthioinosine phosphorylase
LPVPSLVVPDQIIDYTWGRAQTFFDSEIHHIDLSYPYDAALRESLIAASDGFPLSTSGVYGCTQGPRLETAAEVRRLRQDGCDIVGMTAMPEAALARERGISYGALCVVVNPGAGIDNEPVAMEQIEAVLGQGMSWVRDALCRFVSHLPEANT